MSDSGRTIGEKFRYKLCRFCTTAWEGEDTPNTCPECGKADWTILSHEPFNYKHADPLPSRSQGGASMTAERVVERLERVLGDMGRCVDEDGLLVRDRDRVQNTFGDAQNALAAALDALRADENRAKISGPRK